MQYLQQINKSRSIHEGFKLMYRNWHISDVLICNLYERIDKWNSFFTFYNGTSPYRYSFTAIAEFIERYEFLLEMVRTYKQHWFTPIVYVYPITISGFTADDFTGNWLASIHPASGYVNKQVIVMFVITDTGVVRGTFRNDYGSWLRVEDYYRPRGC